LPGEVFLYYGEELGMKGDKPDEQIREPFLWRTAPTTEQCRWVRPVYSRTSTTSPLDEQQRNSQSIYHHYRELLQLRINNPCLVNGIPEQIECKDNAVIVYTLRHQNQRVLVMHNLSENDVLLRNEDKRPKSCSLLYASNGAGIRNNSDFYLPGRSSLLSIIG
jgi:glycosidase